MHGIKLEENQAIKKSKVACREEREGGKIRRLGFQPVSI
jgi:hypothetical protein